MCDRERLVDYIYDELETEQRRAFESHLDACAECRAEVESLRAARSHLALWVPPEIDLGIELVRRRAPSRIRPFTFAPVWALAAAAVVVLAVAAAIAQVEVRAGADGLVIRTGWNRTVQPTAAPPGRGDSAAELQAIRRRLSDLEAELKAQQSNTTGMPAVSSRPPASSDADLLRRVRLIVAESERRQQGMLATRLLQAMRDIEATHRTDLVRLQQDISQTQGLRDAEVIRQREMLNQFYRLVGQQK